MRCPHHNCREMHQSRILLIQSKYVASQEEGTMRVFFFVTAAMALAASGLILTNHCLDTIGSMSVLQR